MLRWCRTRSRPSKPQRPPAGAANRKPAKEATKQPIAPSPEPVKQATVTPDILVADTPRPDDQSVAPKAETPAQPAVQAESAEAPPRRIRAATDSQRQAKSGSPPPRASEADENTRHGRWRGTRRAQPASKGKKQTAAGNAVESRYSGEIQKKLSRANRRVSKTMQLKLATMPGSSSSSRPMAASATLQLAESSGSPSFDQFALGMVRQQAPSRPSHPRLADQVWVFRARIGPF